MVPPSQAGIHVPSAPLITSPPTYAEVASRHCIKTPGRLAAPVAPSDRITPVQEIILPLLKSSDKREETQPHNRQREQTLTNTKLSIVGRRLANVTQTADIALRPKRGSTLIPDGDGSKVAPQLKITIGSAPPPKFTPARSKTLNGMADEAGMGSYLVLPRRPETPLSPFSAKSGQSTPMREAFERIDNARRARAKTNATKFPNVANQMSEEGRLVADFDGVPSMLSVVVASPPSYFPARDELDTLVVSGVVLDEEEPIKSNVATSPSSPDQKSAPDDTCVEGHERTTTVGAGEIGLVDTTGWADHARYPLPSSTRADQGSMYEYDPPASPLFPLEPEEVPNSPARSQATPVRPVSPPPAVSPISTPVEQRVDTVGTHVGVAAAGERGGDGKGGTQGRRVPKTPVRVVWPPASSSDHAHGSVDPMGTPIPYPGVPRNLNHTFSPISVGPPSVLQSPHRLVPDSSSVQYIGQGVHGSYLPLHAGSLYPYALTQGVYGQIYGSPTYVSTDYAPSGHEASPYAASAGFVSPWSSPAVPPQAYFGPSVSPVVQTYVPLVVDSVPHSVPSPLTPAWLHGITPPFNTPRRVEGTKRVEVNSSPLARKVKGAGRGGAGTMDRAGKGAQGQVQVLEKQRLEHARMIRDLQAEHERREAEKEWELAKLRQEVEVSRQEIEDLKGKGA